LSYDSDSRRFTITTPPVPKPRSFGHSEAWHFSRLPLVLSGIVWLALPVCLTLYKAFIWAFMGGFGGIHNGFYLWLQDNLWAADGGFLGLASSTWVLTTFLSALTALIVWLVDEDGISRIEAITIFANVAIFIVSLVGWINVSAYNGPPSAAIYLNSETDIHIPDTTKSPASLSLVFNQKDAPRRTSADGQTLKFGDLATITQGTLPGYQWEPRTSSLSGAQTWIDTNSPSVQGVDPWDATMTYVYGKTADTSRWSVVMDGSGTTRNAYGVSEWRGGQLNVHVCTFDDRKSKGDYKFTRAFAGAHGNSLRNVIAKAYPGLFFRNEDVSGYCNDSDKPVITISMLKNVGAGRVTSVAPACLLVLKGSPSGFPDMNCLYNVQAGQFPVPVYPLSLVSQQRDAIDWAAGRGNKDGANFGYEPSSYASQASNDSDYVLRDTVTGKIYAFTPSKFNKTKSQAYVLYQIEEVDTLTDGQLNHLDAYVQDEIQAVNPSKLDINAHIYMGWVMKQSGLSEFLPITFFSDGGNIEEYVPLSKSVFRGYGVDKLGATRFYIDISTDPKVDPIVTILDIAASSPVVRIQVPNEVSRIGNGQLLQPSVTITCNGKDAKGASPDKLAACLQAYQDELIRQLKAVATTVPTQSTGLSTPTPGATPTPAPSGP